MQNTLLSFLFSCLLFTPCIAQDTFSIVAVDSVTGEVGSAGASCVDLVLSFPNFAPDFLGELFPGEGAINTQASYHPTNQASARTRMMAGDTPHEIISYLTGFDVAGNPHVRQYGVVRMVNGSPQSAAYTGINCLNYRNHITGPNYSIQGNILLGQAILDSMEAQFLRAPGDLTCKLMAALQGANVNGADTRCGGPNGTSSLFAFIKVAQPTDTFGAPSFVMSVKTRANSGIEPLDSLQSLVDQAHFCQSLGIAPSKAPLEFSLSPNPTAATLTIELATATFF